MTLIEELRWRGMIQDMMPGTEEQLKKEMTTAYIGFDPTAESLHIGSLVPILLLVHLQKAGHKPIALVGGATGMIGDPSGKSQERNLLDETTLARNVAGVRGQLERYLNFDPQLPNAAEMANNYDWFKHISFIDFLRDAGKHITINYMMAKDSVKKRIESEVGLSYTEFAYQLMQGYDYYYLYTQKNCKLQMGGSDQWGNITTGTELIRRIANGKGFALTCPLITKADGSKFGKSEGGNVWLDANRTSPYKFYQYWLNTADEDAEKYIRIFTFLSQSEIENLVEEHQNAPHLRILQKRLAEEITKMVHSPEDLDNAIKASAILFGNSTSDDLKSLNHQTFLDVFDGVPQAEIPISEIKSGIDIIAALSEKSGFLPSASEARRALKENSVSVNKEKVTDTYIISENDLINSTFILLQRGKKSYFVVKAV